jgi:hypothetical protein
MLSMKGIGEAMVFMGVLAGLDSAGMGGVHGAAGATVGIMMMLLGVVLIRKSKPKC